MTCDHETLMPSPLAAYAVPDRVGRFNILLRLECADCGQPFRFMGAMRAPPENSQTAELGPWASWSANEIGVMVEPIPADEVYSVAGRA